MNELPLRDVTEGEIATYDRDGVVCLRGLFDGAWIDRLRGAVDRNIAQPGPLVLEYTKEGDPGRYHGDMFMWTWDDDFRAFVFDSPAPAIAARLLGTTRVHFFYDHLLVKEPGTRERTPFHQDLPYWPVQGWQVCSLWLALDPVTGESGAVEYVKGSHRWGKRFRAQSFTGDDRFFDPALEPIPDIEAERDRHDLLSFDLAPGDCVVHHSLTVHGSPGNRSATTRRRGLATRWTGDDATYDPRPATFKLIRDPAIPAGGSLECALFPRVWPRGG